PWQVGGSPDRHAGGGRVGGGVNLLQRPGVENEIPGNDHGSFGGGSSGSEEFRGCARERARYRPPIRGGNDDSSEACFSSGEHGAADERQAQEDRSGRNGARRIFGRNQSERSRSHPEISGSWSASPRRLDSCASDTSVTQSAASSRLRPRAAVLSTSPKNDSM